MKSLSGKWGMIFIGLSLFAYGEGWGQDWKLFKNTEDAKFYYDKKDVTHLSKGIVKVWIKQVYTKKGVADMVNLIGPHYENLSYSLQLWEIDCPSKKQRILSHKQYSVDGNILDTKPAKKRFTESLGKSLSDTVCK